MTNTFFTTLETQFYYNPFFVNGYQIKRIHFFKDGKVIYSTRSGWFGSNNNFKSGLIIPEAKRKLKIDLNIKQSFYIPVKAEYYEQGKFCELYIFVDDEQIKIVDHYTNEKEMTESQIWTHDNITIDILGTIIVDNVVLKTRQTEFGKKVEQMKKELEENYIKINTYDLTQLLKKYDLIKK